MARRSPGLVNNAGIAVPGPVLELSADEFRHQMDVNVIGPIIATQAFGPLLGADASMRGPKGRIVMISSVAGKNGNPLTPAYAASKHAIEGLSESLRRELMLFGIDVDHRCARSGEDADLEQGPELLRHRQVQELALSAVAAEGHGLYAASRFHRPAAGEDRRGRLRRADIAQAKSALPDRAGPDAAPDHGVLPKRMVDKIIAKRVGLMPQGQ